MAEVGYLIGAGASAGCVPVVNQMAEMSREVMKEFVEIWQKNNSSIEINGKRYSSQDLYQICRGIFKRISEYSRFNSSIDTYAKKLFISRREVEYKTLKHEMSFYFTLIQILKLPDKRYDNFWASVLTNSIPPSKIKVLSWNYDFQFEKSFMQFASMNSLRDVSNSLNLFAPGKYPSKGDEEAFMLTKLNGSARFKDMASDNSAYYCNFETDLKYEQIIELFKNYFSVISKTNGYKSELEFAWETVPRDNLISALKLSLEKIVVLVVIGYSFPFFNRKVDQALFDKMTGLNKIIIQDKYPDSIRERLIEFIGEEIPIELRQDVDQFVFPKQLEV